MTDRRKASSPYDRRDDDMYDDDYSEDFDDDDDADTGNRRYKTKSPLNRTAENNERKRFHSSDSKLSKLTYNDYYDEDVRPEAALGSNTHRKARGGMSLASGYFTPSRKSAISQRPDTIETLKLGPTPKQRRSLKSEYMSSTKASVDMSVYDTPRAGSDSPRKKAFYRSNRGRGKGRGRFSQLGRASQEPRVDNITKRVLSARRLKINEMHNLNQDLQQQLKDLRDENKLLKKTQLRTDKALQRFEDQESDLPNLIQRQNNEVRSLKDQIRKWREKYEKTDRYLRDAEDDLEKAKIKLKKMKSLAEEKDLPERSELNKKLNQAELDMEAKDVKIRELERYIQNLEKNHRHELGIERARYKDVHKQLSQLRDDNDRLSTQVREKEKEIQVKNIYVNRAKEKPPHRLPNSYSGTPQGTPPPRRRRPSLSEVDKITPRDRAKMMEEKRREEMKKQRELKMQQEKIRRDNELRKLREEEERRERDRRELEERERQEQERLDIAEKERRMNEQAQRETEERRNREERERLKQQSLERERREKEKREREERERKRLQEERDRREKERREQEERERRERERLEQERRASEERKRFEDDVTLQAERKKKDEILQKLREIDEGVGKSKDKGPRSDPFFVTEDVKEDSQDSMASSKKSYTFSKPVENLHKGKPSHKDAPFTVGPGRRNNRDIDDLETGGYNPTFGSKRGGGATTTKTYSLFDDEKDTKSSAPPPQGAKKSKLMDELFGSSSKDGPKHNDMFASPKPPAKKSNPGRSGFPWDDDAPLNKNQSGSTFKANRENSSTLFGGGSALINDEDLHKSQVRTNATLPRRPKQSTTTFSSRPTVNAVDHFDDEIEEVIL